MDKLFIAMPVKYNGINLVNSILEKLNSNGCSWLYELHILFNGKDKLSKYWKQFTTLEGCKLYHNSQFRNVFDCRLELIHAFIDSDCTHLLMIDPDDDHSFDSIPKFYGQPSADITKFGCHFNSEIVEYDQYNKYYRLRNYSIYHVWHTIFNKRSIYHVLSILDKINNKYNIEHSEDFLINLVCLSQYATIQFRKESFVVPRYEHNSYSNYSETGSFDEVYAKEQEVFKALDEFHIFTSPLEREFHYNKMIMELGIHYYTRSIRKLPRFTNIKEDRRLLC